MGLISEHRPELLPFGRENAGRKSTGTNVTAARIARASPDEFLAVVLDASKKKGNHSRELRRENEVLGCKNGESREIRCIITEGRRKKAMGNEMGPGVYCILGGLHRLGAKGKPKQREQVLFSPQRNIRAPSLTTRAPYPAGCKGPNPARFGQERSGLIPMSITAASRPRPLQLLAQEGRQPPFSSLCTSHAPARPITTNRVAARKLSFLKAPPLLWSFSDHRRIA